jgi:hypothetical protein
MTQKTSVHPHASGNNTSAMEKSHINIGKCFKAVVRRPTSGPVFCKSGPVTPAFLVDHYNATSKPESRECICLIIVAHTDYPR